MQELKEIINVKINDCLADIKYKLKLNVPRQFIDSIQQELFALQWVVEQIERLEAEALKTKD
jgi:hypothetical protein